MLLKFSRRFNKKFDRGVVLKWGAGGLLLILITTIYFSWRGSRIRKDVLRHSLQLSIALRKIDAGMEVKGMQELWDLIQEDSIKNSPYAMIASLKYASLLLEKEKYSEAWNVYHNLLEKDKVGKGFYRDLIRLLEIKSGLMANHYNIAEVKKLLRGYISRVSYFVTMAKELLMVLNIEEREFDQAKILSVSLINDESVLPEVKSRLARLALLAG